MSNQGDRQQTARTASGVALTYNGDMLALFDNKSVAAGDFNGRQLAYINAKLGVTYTNLPSAMVALAVANGSKTWNELGTFTA